MSSHLSKVFKSILNNILKMFLMNNNLIDYEQEGFLPRKAPRVHCTDLRLNTKFLPGTKRKLLSLSLILKSN